MRILALALAVVVAVHAADSYHWELPKGFPKPRVPADNPMSEAKVQLGRSLFYDRRLSSNGRQSCASCHRQELAFTDGKGQAIGTTGERHPRGSMSLVNIAYSSLFTWSNPKIHSLEEQALAPMFGRTPIELGLTGNGEEIVRTLTADASYPAMFSSAFPGEASPVSISNVTKAIAAFERAIISARSPYDRYHYGGDNSAVSESAKRGETLYFSEPLSCFRCHGGFNFGGGPETRDNGLAEPVQSKIPTLRNIAITGPYMHDGRFATLQAVLDHYSSGGRGDAAQDPLIRRFTLTPPDRADLIAFLESLTDREVLSDARFAAPQK
jgi:cytochrome c peroxidase